MSWCGALSRVRARTVQSAARELRPRLDAELRVDPREVRLDRPDADEQLRGDLLVRLARPRRARRPGARSRSGPRSSSGRRCAPARPSARSAQRVRAEPFERLRGRRQGLARGLARLRPALDLAEDEQGAGMLERQAESAVDRRPTARGRRDRGIELAARAEEQRLAAGGRRGQRRSPELRARGGPTLGGEIRRSLEVAEETSASISSPTNDEALRALDRDRRA